MYHALLSVFFFQVVFRAVEQSGCHGIFVKKIKREVDLHETTIGKILEKLERKGFIKSVVNAKVGSY